MIRVCRNKYDLKDAGVRQSRNSRKRERGQSVEDVTIVFVCRPCGSPVKELRLPDGEKLQGIVVPELDDILCPAHALNLRQRVSPSVSMDDLLERLVPSRWDCEPWGPSDPMCERVPRLYVQNAPVAERDPAPLSA